MEKWFNVIKDSGYIKEFTDMFSSFHDYRIEKINFNIALNRIDVILEYDTPDVEKVLLRFEGIQSININPDIDYEVSWLMGTEILLTDDNKFIWYNDEGYSVDEVRRETTLIWIEADWIRFALLDGDGMPTELPDSYLHQSWRIMNYQTMKYEEIERNFRVFEFHG